MTILHCVAQANAAKCFRVAVTAAMSSRTVCLVPYKLAQVNLKRPFCALAIRLHFPCRAPPLNALCHARHLSPARSGALNLSVKHVCTTSSHFIYHTNSAELNLAPDLTKFNGRIVESCLFWFI